MNLETDLVVLAPELILALGAMALLLLGAKCGERSAQLVSRCAIAVLVAAGAALVWTVPEHASAFHGAFIADGFARFAKLFILIAAALSILLAEEYFADIALSRFELPVLMLLATLGMLLMVSATSFLALYMAWSCKAWRCMCSPPSTATICVPPKRGLSISCWARCRRA